VTTESSNPTQELLHRLARELFQTETSAVSHCTREAERLTHAEPAAALRELASHADEVLQTLPDLARSEGLPNSKGGNIVGATFSQLRDKVADKLLDRERSYRGTILGVRHGVDVVRLLGAVAHSSGRTKLESFCKNWLDARLPLVHALEEGLLWFGKHPERAVERATPLLGRPKLT
jgi:hypothetical protein